MATGWSPPRASGGDDLIEGISPIHGHGVPAMHVGTKVGGDSREPGLPLMRHDESSISIDLDILSSEVAKDEAELKLAKSRQRLAQARAENADPDRSVSRSRTINRSDGKNLSELLDQAAEPDMPGATEEHPVPTLPLEDNKLSSYYITFPNLSVFLIKLPRDYPWWLAI